MEFASILSELVRLYDKECNQRSLVEEKLENVKRNFEQLKLKFREVGDVSALQATCLFDMDDELKMNTKEKEERGSQFNMQIVADASDADAPATENNGCARKKAVFCHHVDELAMMKGWKEYTPDCTRASSRSSIRTASELRASLRSIVSDSKKFDLLVAFGIVANSIVVGISVDYAARRGTQIKDNPRGFKIAERAFTVLFAGELLMRLLAGFEYFCKGMHKYWNYFDLIVVGGDITQMVLEATMDTQTTAFSMLRAMRFVRVARAIRLVRLVRFFKELRMMIYSILRCGTSCLWSLLLFLIIFYIFGVFLMIQVTEFLGGDGQHHGKANDLKTYFGSIPQAVLILYACMSGGISWTEVSNALSVIHWSNVVVLALFVFFSLFVVANIMTGIFVETAIQSAASDREEIIQEQIASQESELMVLQSIFQEADEDGSGEISESEFQHHLAEERVRAHLNFLGIHVNEAMGLFKLLDQDESGHIGIDEFVMGCMRLKGGAKGIDLATMMYESKKLVEHINKLDVFCKEQFDHLKKSNETVLHSIQLYRRLDNPNSMAMTRMTEVEAADLEPRLCEVPPSRNWNEDLFTTLRF